MNDLTTQRWLPSGFKEPLSKIFLFILIFCIFGIFITNHDLSIRASLEKIQNPDFYGKARWETHYFLIYLFFVVGLITIWLEIIILRNRSSFKKWFWVLGFQAIFWILGYISLRSGWYSPSNFFNFPWNVFWVCFVLCLPLMFLTPLWAFFFLLPVFEKSTRFLYSGFYLLGIFALNLIFIEYGHSYQPDSQFTSGGLNVAIFVPAVALYIIGMAGKKESILSRLLSFVLILSGLSVICFFISINEPLLQDIRETMMWLKL